MSNIPGVNCSWPASETALRAARSFLQKCSASHTRTLLLPDKDADGLCASSIIYRTLLQLGLSAELIAVHFVTKGSNVHEDGERTRIEAFDAQYIIVVDQGSRPGGPIVRRKDASTLIVDHHWTNTELDYPQDALVLSAARHKPVATSSTLAYILCSPLIGPDHIEEIDYLCAIGTFGDLGTSFGFKPSPPWPLKDMQVCMRRCTKKSLCEAVSLLNAPRRTATYDVRSAWDALLADKTSPRSVISSPRLRAARQEVNNEINKVARNRPWFSGDGRVALIRVTSGAQVHPVIATRWASSLKSSKLEIVMCANDGYLPGMTNFSCRVAKCVKDRLHDTADSGGGVAASSKRTIEAIQEGPDQEIDIIALLHDYASREAGLRESMGENFARGHKEASGGIVRSDDFQKLWNIMQTSQTVDREGRSPMKRRKKVEDPSFQKNTLDYWLKRV